MPRDKTLEEDLLELREERRLKEEQGTLPREIDRHHKFPFNEHPLDDDAHPDSGWLYATKELAPEEPGGPVIRPRGGPDAGMVCQIDGCEHRLRIVDEFSEGEILKHVEGGQEKVFVNPVGVCILMCARDHMVQIRKDCLPGRSSGLWLP